MFPVERLGLDLRWQLGEKAFRARGSLTGGAAAVAAMSISNSLLGTAATTGYVVIIEKFEFSVGTTQVVTWGLGFRNADLLAAAAPGYGGLDTRGTPAVPGTTLLTTRRGAASVFQDSTQQANVYSTALWINNVAAGQLVTFDEEIVLSPGFCFDLYCNTVNTALYWNIRWRERPLDALELNA